MMVTYNVYIYKMIIINNDSINYKSIIRLDNSMIKYLNLIS